MFWMSCMRGNIKGQRWQCWKEHCESSLESLDLETNPGAV